VVNEGGKITLLLAYAGAWGYPETTKKSSRNYVKKDSVKI